MHLEFDSEKEHVGKEKLTYLSVCCPSQIGARADGVVAAAAAAE